ncbi:ribbon-helix-helix protein, CopG family [Sphingobium boeckii]|uniref:Putative transcriptional regulator n=1 Tax=Sphingobium boeckii TaxID=1082345 RepID=A0A7W9AIK4_9SPHN|nr:ribbon-helix-helix protein, CopG family [Sphingobium boeckii]MBB5686310.1 putative transcriptional regulator [Sphingobium boeckii]
MRHKTRHQFHLPDALSEQLNLLAAKPGASKSIIMAEAITAWIERKGMRDTDDRFGAKIDRLVMSQKAQAQDIEMIIEMLSKLIWHEMLLTAHQPPSDETTRSLARKRFQMLFDQVAQDLAAKDPRRHVHSAIARVTPAAVPDFSGINLSLKDVGNEG